jgi:hypothetical protein
LKRKDLIHRPKRSGDSASEAILFRGKLDETQEMAKCGWNRFGKAIIIEE